MAKAKQTKHTSAEIKGKERAANANKGGGAAGEADRKGGKAGHAKYKCPSCGIQVRWYQMEIGGEWGTLKRVLLVLLLKFPFVPPSTHSIYEARNSNPLGGMCSHAAIHANNWDGVATSYESMQQSDIVTRGHMQ